MEKVSYIEAADCSQQAVMQDESLREDQPLGEVSYARVKARHLGTCPGRFPSPCTFVASSPVGSNLLTASIMAGVSSFAVPAPSSTLSEHTLQQGVPSTTFTT
jgi:hypothetical protein